MDPQLGLLRHGETAWSVAGRHTGRSDIPLTTRGEHQAVDAGSWLHAHCDRRGRGFAVVHVSPRIRARHTAQLAGYNDVVVDPDLAEWDYGPVDGRTRLEVSAELGRDWDLFRDGVNVLPGKPGESLENVARRAGAAIDRVTDSLDNGGDVLLIAHGHLLRILAAVWLGADPALAARLELGTAAICLLGTGHGRRTVEGWNLTRD